MIRMTHPQHGWHNALAGEVEDMKKNGWIVEVKKETPQEAPQEVQESPQEVKRPLGRPKLTINSGHEYNRANHT